MPGSGYNGQDSSIERKRYDLEINMWPFKKKDDKQEEKPIVSQIIGPFDLGPGESKEFEVNMPIPKGMSPEEALERLKKSVIIFRGSYVDKSGKMHKFEQRIKPEGDDKK